jgi:endonuclease III related protein
MQERKLQLVYERLLEHFGPQDWWPAKTRFEVVVGAILTQNTNWKNVEQVILDLKSKGLLDPKALDAISINELAPLLRKAGYFNQKARRLKAFVDYFRQYNFSFEGLMEKDKDSLREELLSIWGIGPETADDILLYALDKPSFVIDAYTRRVFSRMGLARNTGYDALKAFFETNPHWTEDRKLETFKEYHALIDELAKGHCRTKPFCKNCPLCDLCLQKI